MTSNALFITGTGTDIGKSALSLAICLYGVSHGLKTIYFKPVQCGLNEIGNGTLGGDGEWLESVSPHPFPTFCSYRFIKPVSPHLASESEGITLNPEQIQNDFSALKSKYDFVVVEGAGGPAVPLDRKGFTMAGLAGLLKIPPILACSPSLGTISHTVTAHHYLAGMGMRPLGFVFCFTNPEIPDIFRDNRDTIAALTGLPCLGHVPFISSLKTGAKLSIQEAASISEHLHLRDIL